MFHLWHVHIFELLEMHSLRTEAKGMAEEERSDFLEGALTPSFIDFTSVNIATEWCIYGYES